MLSNALAAGLTHRTQRTKAHKDRKVNWGKQAITAAVDRDQGEGKVVIYRVKS